MHRTKFDANRRNSRGFPQGFLKLLETAAPYPDSLDVFTSASGQKPFENITLARTAARVQRPPRRTPAEGQPEQVMIPGLLGTISPHGPVIKSETGTGFHAS
ncbi:protein of unknown function [Bradyrhizobium vignae]|uniref:Uncharacterized protein n=1 Tax=Bradyrhizobium vignae TaxID=1549949 RepID=A0A2U3Q0N3_9BRAD|nr:protein of unknown function [Bradyrhizobium vignae]